MTRTMVVTEAKPSTPVDAFEQALRRAGRSEHGIAGALSDVRQFVEHLGEIDLAEATTDSVLGFLRWLQHDRLLRPTSLRRKLSSVRLFYGYLRHEGVVATDPTFGVSIDSPPTPRPLPLTHGQARRLIDAARREPRWHAAVLLMLTAGLKRDELLRLRWRDVSDPQPDRVQIVVRPRRTGNPGQRTLSLPSTTSEVLVRLAKAESAGPDAPVIPLTPRGLSYAMSQCAQRAGLDHLRITPQRLRDTFAVCLLGALLRRELEDASRLSRRGRADVRRGYEQGFLQVLGVGRNRALINHYRAALVESEDADGAEGVLLRDGDFASADEL